MGKSIILLLLCFIAAAQTDTTSNSESVNIIASQPTHYFYTPTANVNQPYSLVISLHEISFSFPGNIQVQASLFDNIGRINLGAKYGFTDNLSAGAGLASTLIHLGNGSHGIKSDDHRLGLFFCYGFVKNPTFEGVVVPHSQLLGKSNSLGCDLGTMFTPSDFWSIILEIGTSYDFNSEYLYCNTDGGIRLHPPSIPFLNFDLGVDVQEFAVNVKHPATSASVYFDVIFAMKVK